MPPKILNYFKKNQKSRKITENQGFMEEKTFGLARRNKRLACRNKGLAGQTRHLERKTLHPARQTGHRARPIKGSAHQTTRLPRQSLLQRVQFVVVPGPNPSCICFGGRQRLLLQLRGCRRRRTQLDTFPLDTSPTRLAGLINSP